MRNRTPCWTQCVACCAYNLLCTSKRSYITTEKNAHTFFIQFRHISHRKPFCGSSISLLGTHTKVEGLLFFLNRRIKTDFKKCTLLIIPTHISSSKTVFVWGVRNLKEKHKSSYLFLKKSNISKKGKHVFKQ